MKRNYISCPTCFMDYYAYTNYPDIYKPTKKVNIELIRINKRYFAFPNKVDSSAVAAIVNNFCLDAWEPIFINSNFYLTDGQHRLAAANKMKLKYLDVVIID